MGLLYLYFLQRITVIFSTVSQTPLPYASTDLIHWTVFVEMQLEYKEWQKLRLCQFRYNFFPSYGKYSIGVHIK
jgi:hypothetical protein